MSQVKQCCESLIRTGFGRLELPSEALLDLNQLLDGFYKVEQTTKQSYSFVQDTDGFLPFGSEYALIETHPDLCERFCYWPARRAQRQEHPFSQSAFVHAAERYAAVLSQLAEQVLAALCDEFDAAPLPSTRAASYLQLCAYGELRPDNTRRFAQDPHEDGHLLSFIKPNQEGLVLVKGRDLEPARLLKNEVAILAGSLLTKLSDNAIPAAYHAVLMPEKPTRRSSLVYFVNPAEDQPYNGLVRQRPVTLREEMLARHTGFGNHALQLVS